MYNNSNNAPQHHHHHQQRFNQRGGGGGHHHHNNNNRHHNQHHHHSAGAMKSSMMVPEPQQQHQIFSKDDFGNPLFYKALERQSKPAPPWCFGSRMPTSLSEEMAMFAAFTSPTDQETVENDALIDSLRTIARSTWGKEAEVNVQLAGINAAGIIPYQYPLHVVQPITPNPREPTPPRAPLHLIVTNTNQLPFDRDTTNVLLENLAAQGFTDGTPTMDYRGTACVSATHSGTLRPILLRYGLGVERTRIASDVFRRAFSTIGSAPHVALITIDALLRQCRIIDDVNTHSVSSEAIAVMLLSVINSYDTVPTADRILIDFFLMYGFTQAFDPSKTSVSHVGSDPPEPKVHTFDSLSVLDPGETKENLTFGVGKLKLQHTLAIFGYCYRVLNTFCNESDESQRRAQSALSTVLGGDPMWPRLERLFRDSCEPYTSGILSFFEQQHQQQPDEAGEA